MAGARAFSGPADRRLRWALCIVAHADDRTAHRTAEAWPCARDRLTYPDMGEPHRAAEAWLFGGTAPTLRVDVGAVVDQKIDARVCHISQTANPAALRRRWRHIAAEERFIQVDLR